MTFSALRPQVSSPSRAAASSMRGDGVGGAEDLRLLPLELDRVDGDDVAGAGQRRALHRVHADAAAADDHDGLARLDLGGVGRRAPAGGDAAGHERGLVERDVRGDLDDRRLVHDAVLGERAEAAHGGDVVALVIVMAGGAVLLATRQQRGAQVAQVLVAGRARRADAARRHERGDDVVADLEALHVRTDLDDLAGALVAGHDRELLPAHHGGDLGVEDHVAGDQVLVGVAHAARRELHQDLAVLGRVELDLLDLVLGVRRVQHRGLGLHQFPLAGRRDGSNRPTVVAPSARSPYPRAIGRRSAARPAFDAGKR